MIAMVAIDYDECVPSTYRGAMVFVGEDVQTFATGDPSADYQRAMDAAKATGFDVYWSSSVDDFVMDGGTLTTRTTTN